MMGEHVTLRSLTPARQTQEHGTFQGAFTMKENKNLVSNTTTLTELLRRSWHKN